LLLLLRLLLLLLLLPFFFSLVSWAQLTSRHAWHRQATPIARMTTKKAKTATDEHC
jgi:hypothetical protein